MARPSIPDRAPIAWSPDGKRLAYAVGNKILVRTWGRDLASEQEIASLLPRIRGLNVSRNTQDKAFAVGSRVTELSIAPDGKLIAVAEASGTLSLWLEQAADAITQSEETLREPSSGWVRVSEGQIPGMQGRAFLAFSPREPLLIVGCGTKLLVLRVDEQALRRRVQGTPNVVHSQQTSGQNLGSDGGTRYGRKLALFFDGTWINRGRRSVVIRMREAINSSGPNDPGQPSFYDPGVGTHWYDKLTGGAFGPGLSENIRQGYLWLAQKYEANDDIYLFGFSRGAYTVRSLVGLIRKCGILNLADPQLVAQAYDLYRDYDVNPDHPIAVAFRASHSREARVRFIGVWDTVGALGIPVSGVPFGRDRYRWHDTDLSRIVDFAYHAIAVDEHRKDYAVAVWTKIKPENIAVEQKWFIGAHSNVGGIFDKHPADALSNLPLRWMQDKVEAVGLKLRAKQEVGPQDHLAEIDDSFKVSTSVFTDRFSRLFGRGVNESVHESVWRRWKERPDYRPESLRGHADWPA